ncbi:MAG: hypothetical protein HYX90_07580 [Chloroflexi bacterium]|nr:hypothetical protein [Chloroflexota bacterium]
MPYGLTTDAPQALVSSTLYNQLGSIREINLNNGLRTLFNYHGLDAVDNAGPANHWGRQQDQEVRGQD